MNPIAKLVLQVGVPAAIAMYLVYLLGGSLTSKVDALVLKMDAHATATNAVRQAIDDQSAGQKILISLTQQMCVNAAKTNGERSACFEASRAR